MKANKFFLGLALIGAILTGCDNKEPESVTGDAYVSVQISMASTTGTRADDGGFAVGTTEEQTIDGNKSIFLFYDEDGKWVTSGQLVTQAPGKDNVVLGGDHETHINDRSTDAYIVLSGPDEKLKKSTQVLTIVNYSGCETLKYLDLTQALEQVTTSATDPASAGFLMSTSVYVDNKEIINTTAIDGNTNICKSASEAKAHPVKIYIERASAKAELKVTAANPTTLDGEKQIVVDGALTSVEINIIGWTLNNVHESTYLVKKLHPDWKTADPVSGWTAWNWAANHRSYWAMGCNWGATDGTDNTVRTYKEATTTTPGATPMYCYENTVKDNNLDNYKKELIEKPNVNTVLIAATVNLEGKSLQDLFRYGGIYYTADNYKTLLAKQINDNGFRKGGLELTKDDITTIETNGTLDGIQIKVASGDYTPSSATDVEYFINNTSYVKEAKGYKGGKCYYQIPVEHLSGLYGMVRNHWYQIDIKSINCIGEAVYNDEFPIPYLPAQSEDFYLSAEIHVLSWHVVEQSVDL